MKSRLTLNTFIYCICLISLHACAQNKTDKAILQDLLCIKHYDQRSEYRLQINGMNCNWDIEVNGMPLDNYHGDKGGTSVDLPLNPRILRSEEQKITVKVYPLKGNVQMSIYSTLRIILVHYSDNTNYEATRQVLYNYPLPSDSVKNMPYFGYQHLLCQSTL